MSAPRTVVIVGACIGGVRTAQALRSEGFDGRIVLVGDEPDLPYDRPPLSKQFLAGTWDAERIGLLTAEQAADTHVELRLGIAATHLDVAAREVVLAGDGRIGYDMIVVATGSSARPSPWRPDSGVHIIRSLTHSRGLRQALADDGPLIVVGGGFIGAEIAATAHAAGRGVTVVDPLPSPMSRVLGEEVGALLGTVHQRHGVTTRFGVGVQDVTGTAGDLQVTLTDGDQLAAATVVVGIGATPNVGWLASSGLLVEDGLVCDEHGRAVDSNDVYGVGDVARWLHPDHGETVRAEHWTNAVEQASCVARNIMHPSDLRAYRPTHFVWSDQYDWRIQIVGRPHVGASHDIIGDTESDPPRFAVLYRGGDDNLVGVATVNWPKAQLTSRQQIGNPAADVQRQIENLATPTMVVTPP